MKRATWLVCVALAAWALASCGSKPEAPAPEPGEPAAAEGADPGASDVGVDYAIGKTQLEAKKQIEAQLEEVQKDREKRIEEALGE